MTDTSTKFSKLSKGEQLEFLESLKNYFITYRQTLNLNSQTNFGSELELVPEEEIELLELINKYSFFKNSMSENPDEISYDTTTWQFVTEFNLIGIRGFEVASPILTDNKDTWVRILEIFKILEQNKILPTELCSSHLHYDFGALVQGDPEKVLMIYKLWMLYEDIIFRFAYGEYINGRQGMYVYAVPIALKIKRLLENFPHDEFSLVNILRCFYSLTDRNTSVNVENCYYHLLHNNYIDTIEFRVPNGVSHPTVLQNNVNFFGKFLEYATGEPDLESITYLCHKRKAPSFINTLGYSKIDIDRAFELADLIFKNDLDKINFLRQYIKDGTETDQKRLVKSSPFYKTN